MGTDPIALLSTWEHSMLERMLKELLGRPLMVACPGGNACREPSPGFAKSRPYRLPSARLRALLAALNAIGQTTASRLSPYSEKSRRYRDRTGRSRSPAC